MINAGNRVVNNWIYSIGENYVLIDTGYENGMARLKRNLAKSKIDIKKISYIFLTHAHDDHAGYLNEILLECPEIQIVMSSKALERLYIGQNSFSGGCTTRFALFFCKVMRLFGKGKHLFPKLKPEYQNRCIMLNEQNREEVEQQLHGRVIETPGHTCDSISLMLNDGSLFCGDAAMNDLPSLHRITIWVEDKEDFLCSWKTIIALTPTIIYPGHGRPFDYNELHANIEKVEAIKLLPLKNM